MSVGSAVSPLNVDGYFNVWKLIRTHGGFATPTKSTYGGDGTKFVMGTGTGSILP